MDRISQTLLEINQTVYGIKFLGQMRIYMVIGEINGHIYHFISIGPTNMAHWQLRRQQEDIDHGSNFR